MSHGDANTGPYTLRESATDEASQTVRRYLILYLRGIYLIVLPQFGWVVFAASAAFGCTRLTAAKIKRRRLKSKRERDRGSETGRKGDEDILFFCVCTRAFVAHRLNLIIHT